MKLGLVAFLLIAIVFLKLLRKLKTISCAVARYFVKC